MISTLIFDADGVLINAELFSETLARDYNVDKLKEKEFFSSHFQDCLIGKADLKESIAPYLASFGWRGTVDEFLEYWFKASHSLDEALIDYIQKLRRAGKLAALATNQEKYRTNYMLKHMGFEGVFDKVYSSAHLGLKKPAIEFFAKIAEDLEVPKHEILFWDDDQNNIDGAKKYGIHAEFYTNYNSFVAKMKTKYNLAV